VRRAALTALAVVALLVAGGGIAWGADAIGTAPATNEFDKSVYNMAAGENPVLTNDTIGTSHDVTSFQPGPDGKPLFRSATIATNKNAIVRGTEYLPPGDYHFLCSVHGSGMDAMLHVGPGAAVPRPLISVTILSGRLNRVRNSGKLRVKVADAGSNADNVALAATVAGVTIARQRGIDVAAGTARNVALELTSRGKLALKGRKKAVVKVNGTVEFGKPDTTRRTLG
jgi:plastocyanin